MSYSKFRCLAARFLRHCANYLYNCNNSASQMTDGADFDLIPKGQYDYVPKGTSVFGPADRFLLVPKNRYRVKLLPDQRISDDLGIGWITEDNSAKSYDQLWGDSNCLEAFRSEGDHVREKLAEEIVGFINNEISPEADVVDIGCGVGDLLLEVRKRNPNIKISGLDFSIKAVDGAQVAIPDGSFILHKIEKILPFNNNVFDVVLCTDVLEHLEYPKIVISELVRICRPGGIVALVVPDGDVDQFLGHYWFWNENSLKKLLTGWQADVIRLPQTREFLACIRT